MSYPKELFRGDQYRVTFSAEEHKSLNADGWADERQSGKSYRPYTAVDEAAELPVDGEKAPSADSDSQAVNQSPVDAPKPDKPLKSEKKKAPSADPDAQAK